MAMSTLARLFSGVVLFFILARFLGPQDYGILVYHFSVAMMLTLVVEYGYTTLLVKTLAENPSALGRLYQEAVVTKVYLLGIYLFVCGVLFVSGLITLEHALIFGVMVLAAVCMSLADFFNVAFRGIQKFQKETVNVTIASVLHFAIVTPTVFFSQSILVVGISFVASRLLFLLISVDSFYREFKVNPWNSHLLFDFSLVKGNLKAGFAYAADNGLVNLRSYLDIIFINHLLGASAVGLYQAGMNIVKAIENLAPVFANVYLPKFASLQNNLSECQRQYRALSGIMLGAGFILLLSFCLVPQQIIIFVLGKSYGGTAYLFPLFGIFLCCRFMTIAQGVIATAFGLQRYRMYAGLLTLILLAVTALTLISWFGLAGAVMANISVTLFLLLYFTLLLRIKKVQVGTNIYPAMLFSGAMGFMAVLFFRV